MLAPGVTTPESGSLPCFQPLGAHLTAETLVRSVCPERSLILKVEDRSDRHAAGLEADLSAERTTPVAVLLSQHGACASHHIVDLPIRRVSPARGTQ